MIFRVAITSLLFGIGMSSHADQIETQDTDPNLWLEELHSPRVDTWIASENAKTLATLTTDARYGRYLSDVQHITAAKDRIPDPEFINHDVYNFWQDEVHVRGIWRRTSLTEYKKSKPHWTTVLDLDELSRSENINWVWQGADCEGIHGRRCMLYLSDGGEDATTTREFDLASKSFLKNGFVIPHGKVEVAWQDENTLLVVREWNAGELTRAGYPYIIKRLKRGQSFEDSVEVYRGSMNDSSVEIHELHAAEGAQVVVVDRFRSYFEADHSLVIGSELFKLGLPLHSNIQSLVDNQLIVNVLENWNASGIDVPSGSVVALDMDDVRHDPVHLLHPVVIYSPSSKATFDSCVTTKHALMLSTFENVRSRIYLYHLDHNKSWQRTKLAFDDGATITLKAADEDSDLAIVEMKGFLQPPAQLLVDAKKEKISELRQLPARFDASHIIAEQFSAKSSDGISIPYFVVHQQNYKLDGSNPTILYAYGGFNDIESPYYNPLMGKLWIEKGGVFVLANIRGGGEFGPAWHDAGLKTHRQIVFDDFTAVARDLITRGITSPRRLGIEGGSNGGLLMGVEFTQHPELWNAVDMQVPLLDMLRFESIDAGASWVGEYGSVAVPEERAFLASISPYANLKKGIQYPEPFIWTTSKDDRVGPQHARKFAARLSEYGIPYLFYENAEGGHATDVTLFEKARMSTLEMIYFTRKLMD